MEYQFSTKVVGVTFDNRQAYLSNIKENDKLTVLFEPNNPYDSNAIALLHNGNKIGYFSRKIAANLKPTNNIDVTVINITQGGKNTYGCNIYVEVN